MGLPRTYKVCLLIVKHSFAETGPGSAAQLAGYWEVFSPGPLTKDLFETPRGSVVDGRMGVPGVRGGREASGDATRPEIQPTFKTAKQTSMAVQKTNSEAGTCKFGSVFRVLLLILLSVLSETAMIKELKDVTDLDKDVTERYNGAERGREAWLQDEGMTNEPRVDPVHPWLSYRTVVDELRRWKKEGAKLAAEKKTAVFVSVFKAKQSGSVASASKFTESTGDCYTDTV